MKFLAKFDKQDRPVIVACILAAPALCAILAIWG
jgi:hypothetical protein